MMRAFLSNRWPSSQIDEQKAYFPEDDQDDQGDQELGSRPVSPTVGHLRGSSSEMPHFPEGDQDDQGDQGDHLDQEDFLPECETSDLHNDAFQNWTPLGGESEWIC